VIAQKSVPARSFLKGVEKMKKGDNIPEMSGPQATRVFKLTETIIDVIEYRHEVADMTSACFAEVIAGNSPQLILCGGPAPVSCLQAMFTQPRQTWHYFEMFQKRFALRWKTEEGAPDHEGWWELDGAPDAHRPDDGPEAAEGDPPDGSGGPVCSFSGGFFLPPPSRKQRARPPRRGRRPQQPPVGPVDQGRAPAQPKAQPVAAGKRAIARVLCKTRRALRTMQRASRFRHIKSQIEGSVTEMKAMARLSRDTAHALLTVARRWLRRGAVELRTILTGFDHAACQSQTKLQPKAIELRQGFTLVLYSFDNPDWESWLFGKFEHPNWESWLFGRRAEDERLSA
jgi:hypothetical protein